MNEAADLRRKRLAMGGKELLRRQREETLDRAMRNCAMNGDWKMLRDVILDQGERIVKLEHFAADLIAELEASRERKK